jgi:hypothetical protein
MKEAIKSASSRLYRFGVKYLPASGVLHRDALRRVITASTSQTAALKFP